MIYKVRMLFLKFNDLKVFILMCLKKPRRLHVKKSETQKRGFDRAKLFKPQPEKSLRFDTVPMYAVRGHSITT